MFLATTPRRPRAPTRLPQARRGYASGFRSGRKEPPPPSVHSAKSSAEDELQQYLGDAEAELPHHHRRLLAMHEQGTKDVTWGQVEDLLSSEPWAAEQLSAARALLASGADADANAAAAATGSKYPCRLGLNEARQKSN